MKVLKHVFGVSFTIIVLSILIDKFVFTLFNVISDEVYTGQSVGKLNHYLRIKDTVDVLIYGNSRVGHHVDPDKIPADCFNMGVNGRKIAYSSTLVNLLETNREQTILFHIDTDNAFSTTYNGDDILALSVKYNRNEIVQEHMDELDMGNPFQAVYSSLSYNAIVLGILKNYFRPKYDYTHYNGFEPILVSENQRKIFMNKLNKTDKKPPCASVFKMNEIYYNALVELKKFCKKNNKMLVLFTSPKFADTCSEDNHYLAKKLNDMGFEYYDFTSLFQEDYNLDYWKDNIHLSGKGAEIFSEKLYKRLEEDKVPYFWSEAKY